MSVLRMSFMSSMRWSGFVGEATNERHAWILPLRKLLGRIKNQSHYLTSLDATRIQKSPAQNRTFTPPPRV